MALEESRKRKTPEREDSEDSTQENAGEPNSKELKIDVQVEADNSNLKSEDLQAKSSENQDLITSNDAVLATEIANDEDVASICIKFKDESIADIYRARFIKFINKFIELEAISHDKLTINVIKDNALNPQDWEVVDETLCLETTITEHDSTIEESPQVKRKRKKKNKVKKELFVVDATPSSQDEPAELRYTSKFVISTEKNENSTDTATPSSRQACFNCDQNHALKDCPEPKDFSRINAARMKFRSQPKPSRYHLEEEQKFGHLKPGVISHELRKALGLPKNELPHYIYLMRRLGYPPGWLEEAKIVNSDLDMFDIDGKNVKGKISKKRGLDPEKIVDYPGFNVPLEQGFIDDFRAYGVPPYSDDFSKNAMIEYFNKQAEIHLDNNDMDLDNEESDVCKLEEAEPSLKSCLDNVKHESRDSPSLVDLEEQKQKLLEELNEEPTKVEATKTEETEIKSVESLSVKASCFGTPILKSNSPYMKLPDPDNFSKDVSPVINFENLPNSTGKYEQMTDVLQKVRTTMKKIQNYST